MVRFAARLAATTAALVFAAILAAPASAVAVTDAAVLGPAALRLAAPSDPDEGWPELPPGDAVVPPLESGTLTSRSWDTTWGQLKVVGVQSDGTFRAGYDFDEGAIIGRIEGDVLVGWWCEVPTRLAPGDAGEVQFRMIRTGVDVSSERLQGRWSYGLSTESTGWSPWDGTFLDAPADAATVRRGIDAATLCASPFAAGARAPLTLDTPSVLSALPTIQEVTPGAVAAAGGGAVVLVAIATYPAILLEGTLSANRDRLFGWARRPFSRIGAASRRLAKRTPPWLGVTLGLAATLAISVFVDPRAGFNGGTARMLVSLAIALFVERLAFMLLARGLIRRRSPDLRPTVDFALSSLLFVTVAVVLTRITGFEPGMVFGLVLGVAVAIDLSKLGEARFALAASGWALVLGLVGWAGYSILTALLGPDPNAVGVFAVETLSGFAVSGIAALPIALLPIAAVDGGAVWAWKKWVWALVYVVGLAAFFIVVLPMPTSWDAVDATFIRWIALYVGFCLFAVAVWLVFRFLPRRQEPDAVPGPEEPDTPAGLAPAPE